MTSCYRPSHKNKMGNTLFSPWCVSTKHPTRAIHGDLLLFHMGEHHIHNLHRPKKQLGLHNITIECVAMPSMMRNNDYAWCPWFSHI